MSSSEMFEMVERIAERTGAIVRAPQPTMMPVPDDPSFDAAFAREYATAAAVVGYAPPVKFVQNQFRVFCLEHGVPCYDRAQVKAYLDKQYGGATKQMAERVNPTRDRMRGLVGMAGMWDPASDLFMVTRTVGTWAWRPLGHFGGPGQFFAFDPSDRTPPKTSDQLLDYRFATYDKPVPIPVLLRAKDIRQTFPQSEFFISDEIKESDMPAIRDPFLGVRVAGEFWIVDKWDEPSFRG
jgi:hypothetical protein